mmetsp:Transcript_22415/g.42093  ORF Transcript_22415/g.42093 Transcript_22415/m.42093 type:complete len:129 (+) Transcript_22415:327-713(+)
MAADRATITRSSKTRYVRRAKRIRFLMRTVLTKLPPRGFVLLCRRVLTLSEASFFTDAMGLSHDDVRIAADWWLAASLDLDRDGEDARPRDGEDERAGAEGVEGDPISAALLLLLVISLDPKRTDMDF